jgi:hypothetical protein
MSTQEPFDDIQFSARTNILGATLSASLAAAPSYAAEPKPKAEEQSLAVKYGFYVVPQLADLASTEYGLSHGSVERNPAMKNRWARISAKALAIPVFLALVERWMERRGVRWWKYVARPANAIVGFGLSYLNVREVQK